MPELKVQCSIHCIFVLDKVVEYIKPGFGNGISEPNSGNAENAVCEMAKFRPRDLGTE